MSISVGQALWISLFCWLGYVGTPFLGVTAGYFVMGRPLIAGTLVGLILGDVTTGMLIGATINAIFLGSMAPGNVMASDVTLAGYVATALAMASGQDTSVALAIAVPVGLFGVMSWNIYNGMNVFFMHLCDKYAAEGDVKKIWSIGIIVPQIISFIIRVVPCFLIIYYGAQFSEVFNSFMPVWLTNALTVVGAMLPAVGMALLLKMMITKFDMWAFFILGFLGATVLNISAVPLTLIAIALAFIINSIRNSNNHTGDELQSLDDLTLEEEAR